MVRVERMVRKLPRSVAHFLTTFTLITILTTRKTKAPPDGPDEAEWLPKEYRYLIAAHLSPDRSGAGFSTYPMDHHRTVAKASQGQSLCLSG